MHWGWGVFLKKHVSKSLPLRKQHGLSGAWAWKTGNRHMKRCSSSLVNKIASKYYFLPIKYWQKWEGLMTASIGREMGAPIIKCNKLVQYLWKVVWRCLLTSSSSSTPRNLFYRNTLVQGCSLETSRKHIFLLGSTEHCNSQNHHRPHLTPGSLRRLWVIPHSMPAAQRQQFLFSGILTAVHVAIHEPFSVALAQGQNNETLIGWMQEPLWLRNLVPRGIR